jgi:hypothetical protein
MTAVPADPDAVADRPAGNATTESIDRSGDFVSRHTGIFDTRPKSFLGHGIAMADTTSVNPDPHLPGAWFRDFAFNNL